MNLPPIIQVGDVILTTEIFTEPFCCDLDACGGACCIEGDAGAPLRQDEVASLEDVLDTVWPHLSASAQSVIDRQGVAYVDEEGDLVTSIVGGKDCVFTCYDGRGTCLCATEKAYREGRIPHCKPSSCHLYPVRLSKCGVMTAVNLHRWKVCRSAEVVGRQKGIRAYQFLKEPLTRQFGEEWYAELERTAEEWLKQNGEVVKD